MQFKSFWYCLTLFLLSLCLQCGGSTSQNDFSPSLSLQNCGDGILNSPEACDDGNTNNSDGCNAHCAFEVGEAICGNGVLENQECCDDENTQDGDGCNSNCTLGVKNNPPTAPLLSEQPADRSTWSPSRMYLSWQASSDPDPDDQIIYDVYFDEGNGLSPNATPYKTDISDNHFIIQSSTDNRATYFSNTVTAIYLEPNKTYSWKVCARDRFNISVCSPERVFNTDDSIVGWWRFDEDQSGVICPANLGKVGAAGGDEYESVCDYSGNGNHAQPWNSAFQLLDDPLFKLLGKSYNFPDIIEIPYSNSLNLSSFSIASRISSTLNTPQTDNFFCKMYMINPQDQFQMLVEYGVYFSGDNFPLDLSFSTPTFATPKTITKLERVISPHHFNSIVVSYDDSLKKVTLASNDNIQQTNLPSNFQRARVLENSIYLGMCQGRLSFEGIIDEIVLNRRPLSSLEITNYMNTTRY